MRKSGFVLGMTVLLAACGSAPGVYDLPLPEALARLERADTDAFRMARQCGILIHFKASQPKDNAITWHVTSSGSEVLSFTVRLTAEGDGTRAAIEVPADPKGGEMYSGAQFYPRPAVRQPLRPAIQELVASALEQRPFNPQDLGSTDSVCNVQRAGLESGSFKFGVDDAPGMDSRQSSRLRDQQEAEAERESFDENYGQPMDNGAGGFD